MFSFAFPPIVSISKPTWKHNVNPINKVDDVIQHVATSKNLERKIHCNKSPSRGWKNMQLWKIIIRKTIKISFHMDSWKIRSIQTIQKSIAIFLLNFSRDMLHIWIDYFIVTPTLTHYKSFGMKIDMKISIF
jgi:hypothetical protein